MANMGAIITLLNWHGDIVMISYMYILGYYNFEIVKI